jgi:hypothetical protein
MRRVVTVGMAQKCRVDLYPIELAWGKNVAGGIFTPSVRLRSSFSGLLFETGVPTRSLTLGHAARFTGEGSGKQAVHLQGAQAKDRRAQPQPASQGRA